MKSFKVVILGSLVGLLMGFVLFLVGAILAMLFWKGAPPGKFPEEMIPPLIYVLSKIGIQVKLMSPAYFFSTKLGFGALLGIFYGFIYSRFHYLLPTKRIYKGLFFGLFLWFIAAFPILPIMLSLKKEVFWLLYTFSGLVAFGSIMGLGYKAHSRGKSPDPDAPLSIHLWLKASIISGLFMGISAIIIAAMVNSIARILDTKLFNVPEMSSLKSLTSVMLFSIAWGLVLVPFYRKLFPGFSGTPLRRALSMGFWLWLIRWSLDIVHKICYSQTPVLNLLINYSIPLGYLLGFMLLLNYLNKKMELVK